MKLQKQLSRKYKGKEYSKYVVVIKKELVEELGWKEKEELKAKAKGKKLIIERD